jgi:hypothetical protein
MNLQLATPNISLEAGEVVALDDAMGMCIQPRFGPLWITEENVAEDFVVGAGETFRVKHPGRTLVQAMKATWVTIKECQ